MRGSFFDQFRYNFSAEIVKNRVGARILKFHKKITLIHKSVANVYFKFGLLCICLQKPLNHGKINAPLPVQQNYTVSVDIFSRAVVAPDLPIREDPSSCQEIERVVF